jgi:hypothetical protein
MHKQILSALLSKNESNNDVYADHTQINATTISCINGCNFIPLILYWQLIVYYLLYLTRNVTVAGSSSGIHIYAVFVSKASGEVLKKFSGHADVEVWILPTFENSAWSIMAISFISLLAMSAVLATCFFVRRHRIRTDHPRNPEAREFHGMSSQLVKAMPSLIFTKVQEDNCTSSMCAICLEDYNVGEKLRVLPCRHSMFV